MSLTTSVAQAKENLLNKLNEFFKEKLLENSSELQLIMNGIQIEDDVFVDSINWDVIREESHVLAAEELTLNIKFSNEIIPFSIYDEFSYIGDCWWFPHKWFLGMINEDFYYFYTTNEGTEDSDEISKYADNEKYDYLWDTIVETGLMAELQPEGLFGEFVNAYRVAYHQELDDQFYKSFKQDGRLEGIREVKYSSREVMTGILDSGIEVQLFGIPKKIK